MSGLIEMIPGGGTTLTPGQPAPGTPTALMRINVGGNYTADTNLTYTDSTGVFTAGSVGTNYIAVTSDNMGRGNVSASSHLLGVDDIIAPTSKLHLSPGLSTPNGSPLKMPAGVLLSAPEAGAEESDASGNRFWTDAAAARHQYVGLDTANAFTGQNTFSGALVLTAQVASGATFTVVSTNGPYIQSTRSAAGTQTISLPASPVTGQIFTIVDEGLLAGSNAITISGNGKNINGLASQSIVTNGGGMTVRYSGSAWFIVWRA